jgi:hypothetical protein
MSIHDRTQSIWEELVRIREVLALDSYTRQLEKIDMDRFIVKDPMLTKEVAMELDECRSQMRAYADPMRNFK